MSLENNYVIGAGSDEVLHVLHPRLKYPELWRGCVLAWAPCLGPSGSTIKDNTGSTKNGTLTNMDVSTSWVFRDGKWALSLDATNDYVETPMADTPVLGSITYSVWAYFNAYASYGAMLSKAASGGGTNNPGELRLHNSNGAVRFIVANATTFREYTGTVIPLSTWTHIAVTRSNGIATTAPLCYVNGQPALMTTASGTATGQITGTNAPVRIGSRTDGVTKTNGMLDDVRVYNRELMATEILTLARRRGIAFEKAQRKIRRTELAAAAFKAAWATQRSQIIGGGAR
jgi:hypothetical protein